MMLLKTTRRLTELFVIILISVQCTKQQQGDAKCRYSWITYPESNVPGGTLQYALDVHDCHRRCVEDTKCIGVDFDGARRCFLIYSGNITLVPNGLVTHYQLRRGMESCGPFCADNTYSSWKVTRDAHVIGGSGQPYPNLEVCLTVCNNGPSCTGVDWDPGNPNNLRCWIIDKTNTNPVQQDSKGVNSYYRQCTGNGAVIVTPSNIPNNGRRSDSMTMPTTTARPFSPQPAAFVAPVATGIRPAYIVLIGMGGACLLLVLIAIIVICNYPLKGRDTVTHASSVSTSSKVKKEKYKRVKKGSMQEHRPTSYEDETIGMSSMNGKHHGSTGYASGAETAALGYTAVETANEANAKRESYNNSYNKVPSSYNQDYEDKTHYEDETLERKSGTYNKGSVNDSIRDSHVDYNASAGRTSDYNASAGRASDYNASAGRASDYNASAGRQSDYNASAGRNSKGSAVDQNSLADRQSGSHYGRHSDHDDRPMSGGEYDGIKEEDEDHHSHGHEDHHDNRASYGSVDHERTSTGYDNDGYVRQTSDENYD